MLFVLCRTNEISSPRFSAHGPSAVLAHCDLCLERILPSSDPSASSLSTRGAGPHKTNWPLKHEASALIGFGEAAPYVKNWFSGCSAEKALVVPIRQPSPLEDVSIN